MKLNRSPHIAAAATTFGVHTFCDQLLKREYYIQQTAQLLTQRPRHIDKICQSTRLVRDFPFQHIISSKTTMVCYSLPPPGSPYGVCDHDDTTGKIHPLVSRADNA